jgi:hypothetical protein
LRRASRARFDQHAIEPSADLQCQVDPNEETLRNTTPCAQTGSLATRRPDRNRGIEIPRSR